MVPRQHQDLDAGLTAARNGLFSFRPGRVQQAGQADQGETPHLGFEVPTEINVGAELAGGGGQHPQTLAGHGLHFPIQLSTSGGIENIDATRGGNGGATGRHRFQGALNVQDPAGLHLVHGGHELAGAVKGQLGQTHRTQPLRVRVDPGLIGQGHQRPLGGVPHQHPIHETAVVAEHEGQQRRPQVGLSVRL